MKSRILACLFLPMLLVGCMNSRPAPEPTRIPVSGISPPAQEKPAPVIRQAATPDDAARHCLALAMYWEARGEGQLGMVAVGSVIMNRVESDAFPDTPCDVVYQGGETPPCQFSWWCDGKSDRPRSQQQWNLALNAATEVLSGRAGDPTAGALFFHSTAIRKPWQRQQTAQIGGHLFYR